MILACSIDFHGANFPPRRGARGQGGVFSARNDVRDRSEDVGQERAERCLPASQKVQRIPEHVRSKKRRPPPNPFLKNGPCPASFCLFSSFSQHNDNYSTKFD